MDTSNTNSLTDYLQCMPSLLTDGDVLGNIDRAFLAAVDKAPLDVDSAQRILAAAAILDYCLNGGELELSDDHRALVDRLDIHECRARTGNAARAVWAVSHNQGCALKAEWEAGLRFSEWTTHLWCIHDRLMNQAATIAV